MNDESDIRPLDSETVQALRAELSAPGGDSYWEALHAGIMSRLSVAESQAWWMVLTRWTRPALAAAALVMIIATAAMIALGSSDPAEVAYDDLLEASPLVPVQTARATTTSASREATFQFVMSSNGGRAP